MLKLPYEDFIEEVKAEMYGYEEITEADIDRWFKTLEAFTAKKKKSQLLNYTGKGIEAVLKDESDLFMIVDKYLAAVVNNEQDKYFDGWTI